MRDGERGGNLFCPRRAFSLIPRVTRFLMSESPEHGQKIAQCNGFVPQDGALRLHRFHCCGSLMAAFQDRGSDGEHVLAFLLDFAFDHRIYRENVRHCCACRGEMRVQFFVRVCFPGCLVKAAIEVLRQKNIESNERFRNLDMIGILGL
jgi:hypothetical protein